MSFGQVLEATAALDERALTFGELGMFGMRQTVSPPPSADARPPAVPSTQSLPAQDPLRHDLLRMAATTARAEATAPSPSLSPSPVAGVMDASVFGAQASRTSMALLDRAPLATGKETAMPAIATPGNAPEVRPQFPGQTEIPVAEPESSSASGAPKTASTQMTETWLTLNITDTMASLVIRDMDPGTSTAPSLKARIKNLFAEHGLSLHEFTLNGIATPRPIKTGKEA